MFELHVIDTQPSVGCIGSDCSSDDPLPFIAGTTAVAVILTITAVVIGVVVCVSRRNKKRKIEMSK